MDNQALLLLGGNVGNTREVFERARDEISRVAGEILAVSPLYKTEPWGFESPQVFMNQVVSIKPRLAPYALLDALLYIESLMGRQRKSQGYESRIIDIDILFYNDQIIQSQTLTIPHPRLHLRNFALYPLSDISPQFVHPVFKKTIAQLKSICTDKLMVEIQNCIGEQSSRQCFAT